MRPDRFASSGVKNRLPVLVLTGISVVAVAAVLWLANFDAEQRIMDRSDADPPTAVKAPAAGVRPGSDIPAPGSSGADLLHRVRFTDRTDEVGLIFHYDNGVLPDKPGLMIYQGIGSGVAVIDVDGDGFPDLCFPQAYPASPADKAPATAADRMFRNVRGRAADVTSVAMPLEAGYGCGAAAGDIDGDGFADLYVTNAGRNRLLRNNGDGTFQNITATAMPPFHDWTVSALIADLNGDGFPDVYDVNYCDGEAAYTRRCRRDSGDTPRTCVPTEFAAGDDRLFINSGDGQFREVSEAAGIPRPGGRGLGIIAANLDDVPGLDVYVANDMSANFLFLNRTVSAELPPIFEERGVVSGTAYDFDGQAQASMGIAADDADGDGLLDLFVTHFHNESNTFYHQRPGHFFMDETIAYGLRGPSMQTLGFGTQFLDAELDGQPDLFVVNGHVDDFSETGIPFRMMPQFFNNQGGRFVDLRASELGAFFEVKQLGRGLARLDWNQDGLDDVVVSRLIDPAALVVNETARTGHAALILLTGRTDRDAIGTQVTISAGGVTRVRQLVGGGGFASENERLITCGLGEANEIDEIRVRWPGGQEATYNDLPVDRKVHFVEGVSRPFLLPDNSP